MFKPVFEGNIDIFLKADTLLKSGTLVVLNPAKDGYVLPAVAGDQPYGVLGQDVVDRSVDNFKLDSVTFVAYKDELAGVYVEGGMYRTDNTLVDVAYGDKLYVGAGGKFTKAVPATGFTGHVAIALEDALAGEKVRVRYAL